MAKPQPRFPVFAQRLVQAMKDAGVKAKDLADAAGVYPATVSAWRNGEYVPEPARLEIIARQLLVTPSWLTGEVPLIRDGGPAAYGDPVTTLLASAIEEQRRWLTDFASRLASAMEERLLVGQTRSLVQSIVDRADDPLADQPKQTAPAGLKPAKKKRRGSG